MVEIEEVKEVDKLKPCYDLLKSTYRRAAVPLADFSLFRTAFEVLLPKNMIRITLARVKGRPAAVSFDLLYKKTIYAWYGGVDRQYKGYLPNELLTWDILKWGCQNGFELYDFGGAR
ncbi:MAG: GNAT family N-acetyltransferase [Candidatus Saccharicenans sp.]|nr:GNAT family N-acetyltransferase [Candidatus Saccharicenans sp.]MDI6848911.1 GNAT family N-acetyltransferase [Candidatus Saccharicenans sp.]